MLHARACEGFIIGPLITATAPTVFKQFDWSQFAAVCIGMFTEAPPLSHISTHQYHFMQILLRQFREIGFKRIGLVLSEQTDLRMDGHWTAAYLRHQMRHQKRPVIPIFARPTRSEINQSDILNWMQENNLDIAIGDCPGISPPGGIHYLNMMDRILTLPNQSTIEHDFIGIGEAATRMLSSDLVLNRRGLPTRPITQLIETKLYIQKMHG